MTIDLKNIVDLNLKKDQKILNFSDFQKQNIKFDITKLKEAYNQIVQTKKFDDETKPKRDNPKNGENKCRNPNA